MPQVEVDGLTINYDVQGEGEPLLLIPYTSADHACYAFQLPAYTEYFSCVAIDLPGSGGNTLRRWYGSGEDARTGVIPELRFRRTALCSRCSSMTTCAT